MMTSPRAYQQPGRYHMSASVNVTSIGGPALTVPHPTGTHRRPPSASRQFQALFDSLFQILDLLGLSPVFSLGPNLHAIGAVPNNPTRRQRLVVRQGPGTTGLSPSLAPPSRGLGPGPPLRPSPIYNSDAEGDRFSWWAFPGSLAVTKGILRVAPPDLRSRWERACTQRVVDGSRTDRLARDWSRAWLIHHFITAKSAMNPDFNQPRGGCSREVSIHPAQQHCYMFALGQACPRPNGFGRNLRSKTRWFTGFCNSHQVSHFATFFIDARAEISVAESHCIEPLTSPQSEHFTGTILCPGRADGRCVTKGRDVVTRADDSRLLGIPR
ncbi:hypothetical protein HKD37_U058239 [Glycine soja]